MSRTLSLKGLLISLLAGTVLHYAVEAFQECVANSFQCLNGKCIANYEFCNSRHDCEDHSDEKYCGRETRFPCPDGWVRCPSGNKCIPSYFVCNGYTNCFPGESEEKNCTHEPCSVTAFKCPNGTCINRVSVCNGRNDCGNKVDEQHCHFDPTLRCPAGYVRCPDSHRCLLEQWKCDGIVDCKGRQHEEENCENITAKNPFNTAAKIPCTTLETATERPTTTAEKSEDTIAGKSELRSWLLGRKKSGSRVDQWGSHVPRIAVALHLADESTFVPGNSTGEEIRYELTLQLLHNLAKDKKMSSQELALFIHALLVACVDPRDFYGDDLVRELRWRVEASGNYTNPFQILALCNSGDAMTARDVERVTAAYESQQRPFWIDFQALSCMALSCISSRSGVTVDESTLEDMLQELKRRQFRNGTVGNFRTTALVTQALFIHESYQKDFDIDSAMKVLTDGLNRSRSLLDTYYALPVLSRRSLLNVSTSHCIKAPDTEEEALQKVLDVTGETITVLYSIWMGDEINVGRTWRMRMRVNSSIYNTIETAAKIDKRQKVEYNLVDGKPYVAALNGKEDDPEKGTFWFVYLKTLGLDQDPKIVEESPVDVKLQPNQEIILWYKRGPWNGQSLIQKPFLHHLK